MPLQNFVDNQAPTIKAAWLNALDVFYTTVFSGASTIAQVFTVLGFTSFGQTFIGLANAAAARTNLSAAQSGTNVDITSLGVLTSVNAGQLAGLRNRTLNGDFRINQRMVSGTVTLAAFVYGHDRFRAGAAGVTYTFTASGNATVLTISAGSLQHVIEGANLEGGTYCLSWVGTAQGKIGGGAYGASGVINTAGAGADLQLEFGTGTLGLVQLELGSVATAFERRPIGLELNLCQRYYEVTSATHSPSTQYVCAYWKVTKRSAPTLVIVQLNGSGPPTFAITAGDGLSSVYQSTSPTSVGSVSVAGACEL